MRIISGFLKGRVVKGHNVEGTRPTMDRVKESVFGTIQNRICDSVVLDLFCGSGSLGIEAISNGARYCYFVDNGFKIVNILKENIQNFNIENKVSIINKDYENALRTFKTMNIKFDLIFIDPPYQDTVIENIIGLLTSNNLINKGGLVVCEYRFDVLDECYGKLKLLKMKKYSDTFISIYENCD